MVASLSDEVASKLSSNAALRKAFQEAKGDTEFTADGAFIHICKADIPNTLEISVYSARDIARRRNDDFGNNRGNNSKNQFFKIANYVQKRKDNQKMKVLVVILVLTLTGCQSMKPVDVEPFEYKFEKTAEKADSERIDSSKVTVRFDGLPFGQAMTVLFLSEGRKVVFSDGHEIMRE
ncbi:MAG: hypothetical protein LBU65_04410, partial [Planctomycetaceae bacterium]|nr:hypothetical protein [Planctomycetaceae bacterium]